MDKIEELKKRINEIHLVISRVPKDTKKTFIDLANAKFCNDYGMTLLWCLEEAIEYQQMKNTFFENINLKLDYLISKIDKTETTEQKPTKEIKTLSGRRIEMKGGQNG